MPTISVFLGITIRTYFGDHPLPHLHAVYQGYEALIEISSGRVIEGHLPRRVARLVSDWINLHEDAIIANWKRAEALQPLERIPGLDND